MPESDQKTSWRKNCIIFFCIVSIFFTLYDYRYAAQLANFVQAGVTFFIDNHMS